MRVSTVPFATVHRRRPRSNVNYYSNNFTRALRLNNNGNLLRQRLNSRQRFFQQNTPTIPSNSLTGRSETELTDRRGSCRMPSSSSFIALIDDISDEGIVGVVLLEEAVPEFNSWRKRLPYCLSRLSPGEVVAVLVDDCSRSRRWDR